MLHSDKGAGDRSVPVLEVTVETCKNKWKQVRDRFVAWGKILENHSGTVPMVGFDHQTSHG